MNKWVRERESMSKLWVLIQRGGGGGGGVSTHHWERSDRKQRIKRFTSPAVPDSTPKLFLHGRLFKVELRWPEVSVGVCVVWRLRPHPRAFLDSEPDPGNLLLTILWWHQAFSRHCHSWNCVGNRCSQILSSDLIVRRGFSEQIHSHHSQHQKLSLDLRLFMSSFWTLATLSSSGFSYLHQTPSDTLPVRKYSWAFSRSWVESRCCAGLWGEQYGGGAEALRPAGTAV